MLGFGWVRVNGRSYNLTIEHEPEAMYDVLNAAIFDDIEWPVTQISQARLYSTMNIAETEKETHGNSEILIGTYSHLIQRCNLMT